MFQFKDPTGTGRAAVIAVACYAVSNLLAAITAFFMPPDAAEFGPADIAAIAAFFILIASMIFVARWIYRTNANAHSFSNAVSITPGWSIGWFFVPFANLTKPYQGVKETWQASHEVAGRFDEVETPLLPWWWGLWLATNVASTMSFRLADTSGESMSVLLGFDILVAIADVILCALLIQLITRLCRTQVVASHGGIFA